MVSKRAPWGEKLPADQTGVDPGSRADQGRKKADHPPVRDGRLLPGVDGRGAWARRARSILQAHLTDLGGVENTSVAERSLCRRCATLSIALEQLEAKFAAAEGVISHTDLDLYARGTGHLRRTLESLGLERRAKNITPGSPGSALSILWEMEGKEEYRPIGDDQ